jgi:hypothetical protein
MTILDIALAVGLSAVGYTIAGLLLFYRFPTTYRKAHR